MTQRDGGPTRVLVVDDHQTLAEVLTRALDREADLTTTGVALTGLQGVELAGEHRPDVVVMDVQLPDIDGFEATRRILVDAPDTRVVMLTAHTDEDFVVRAAEAGACAFLPKDGSYSRLVSTIRQAQVGAFAFHPPNPDRGPGPWSTDQAGQRALVEAGLTPRERDVLQLLGDGADVRTIAETLGISENTCRGYVKSLLTKFGTHTQLQTVVAAWRLGLLRRSEGG